MNSQREPLLGDLSSSGRQVFGKSSKASKEYSSAKLERGINAFTAVVIGTAVLGGLTFGLDIGTTASTSMDGFRSTMGFPMTGSGEETTHDTNMLTLFAVVFHIATLIGAPIAGKVADRFGRKPTIIASSMLFILGVIWQCCSGLISSKVAYANLLGGRVITGVGNGFVLTVMPLYTAELSPARFRGQTVTLFQLSITIGIFLMAIFNKLMEDDYWGWRVGISLQAVPCLIIVVLTLLVLPESPAFLVESGQVEEAEKALLKLASGHPQQRAVVDKEMRDIEEEIEIMHEVIGEKDPSFMDLFRGSAWPATLCGLMVAMSQNITGVNWFMNYATLLFANLGFQAFTMDLVLKGVNVVATLVALLVVERGGRKFLTFWGSVLVLIIFLCIYLAMAITGVDPYDSTVVTSQTHAVQVTVLILVFTFQAVFAITWGPLGWLVPAEVFPLRLRGKGMSAAVVANMFTNIAAGDYGYEVLESATSLQTTVFILLMLNLFIVLPTTIFLQPETKEVPLDVMERQVFKFKSGGGDGYGTMKEFYLRNLKQTGELVTCRKIAPYIDENETTLGYKV